MAPWLAGLVWLDWPSRQPGPYSEVSDGGDFMFCALRHLLNATTSYSLLQISMVALIAPCVNVLQAAFAHAGYVVSWW